MTDSTHNYGFWVKIAAIASTSTALILVVIKLYAWFVSDASSMLASATDSVLDLFASGINIIALRYALMPADDEHKFGHGKAEGLAGIIQAAFILGSSIVIILSGAERIISPVVIEQAPVALWVTGISIVLTLLLVAIQRVVIAKTGSLIISADSLHYQSDLVLNLGVVVALVLSQGAWLYADGVFTVLVGIFLFHGGGKIIWHSLFQLMDHELADDDVDIIRKAVNKHEQALGLHDLRTRQAGPVRFIQFHLELDDSLSLLEAHSIGEAIEEEIEKALSPCEVLIHHDPHSVVKEHV